MKYQTYLNWCIPEESAIYFDSVNDFANKAKRLRDDKLYRGRLQEGARHIIRGAIDNLIQSHQLQRFLAILMGSKEPFSPLVPHTELFLKQFVEKREIWSILSSANWWDPLYRFKSAMDYSSSHGLLIDTAKMFQGNPQVTQVDEFRLEPAVYEVGLHPEQVDQPPTRIMIKISEPDGSSRMLAVPNNTEPDNVCLVEVNSRECALVVSVENCSSATIAPKIFFRPVSALRQ
jgi:hypothetical protein